MKQSKLFLSLFVFIMLGLFFQACQVDAQTWPTEWIFFDYDPNEDGTGDDRRDVDSAYYNYDNDFIYLLRFRQAIQNPIQH